MATIVANYVSCYIRYTDSQRKTTVITSVIKSTIYSPQGNLSEAHCSGSSVKYAVSGGYRA